MHSFLIPFLNGLLAVFAITGVGKLVLRLAALMNLPWYWDLGFSALAGQAVVNVLVQILLFCGASTAGNLRLLVWLLLGLAVAGHFFYSWIGVKTAIGEMFQVDKFAIAILLLAMLTNLTVALAPSTKMDEIYYHMLMPKRIVEDGGLKFYMLPIESAIVPQMDYQISLSVLHASGTPDAGNLLSYGYSLALLLFIFGLLADLSGNRHLAILASSLCGVGVYATVWHTTGGAHALGDLATVIALAGVLWPAKLLSAIGPNRYTLFLTTAAALAATTKLSLLPLSFVVSALIIIRASQGRASWHSLTKLTGLALLPWSVFYLPLMVWTFLKSGSFWGPYFANIFAPSMFPANILQSVDDLQAFNPGNIVPMIRYAVIEFAPVFFIAIPWLLWTAFRGNRTSRVVSALLFLQAGLVAWKLHFDFRFLGGLEYIVVVAATMTFMKVEGEVESRDDWTSKGKWIAKSRKWILLFAAVPWLASQMYYARPFAAVVSGIMPRDQFLERYIALTKDFQVLDQTLPKDAVLYMPSWRIPNFYSPRPVVLTLLDLHGRTLVYRLTATQETGIEEINSTTALNCGPTVYTNDHAVVETYRTPGSVPLIAPIFVQSCQIQKVRREDRGSTARPSP